MHLGDHECDLGTYRGVGLRALGLQHVSISGMQSGTCCKLANLDLLSFAEKPKSQYR